MTLEGEAGTNQDLVRRIIEDGINSGNEGVLDALLAPGYVNHDLPSPRSGPAGFAEVVEVFRTGFPDLVIYIEDTMADGDMVSTRGYFTGTHQGSFMGVPPSGEPILVKYIDHWRFEAGQAVESWMAMDLLGLMQQIGAIGS